MNKQWDLSILYTGFDAPEFASDLKDFDTAIAEVLEFSGNLNSYSPEALLLKHIELETKLSSLAEKLIIYANLRYSANTADNEAASTMGVLMGKLSAVAAPSAAINKAIAKIENIESIIENNQLLKEHSYRILTIVKNSKHLLSDAEEELFATPCWYAPGSERAAKIENGKVVIKDRWDLYYGGGNVVFVFDEQGWDSYGLSTMPSSTPLKPYHHRADLELSRDYFVAYYPDSLLVFSADRVSQLKEGDQVALYFLKA